MSACPCKRQGWVWLVAIEEHWSHESDAPFRTPVKFRVACDCHTGRRWLASRSKGVDDGYFAR